MTKAEFVQKLVIALANNPKFTKKSAYSQVDVLDTDRIIVQAELMFVSFLEESNYAEFDDINGLKTQ